MRHSYEHIDGSEFEKLKIEKRVRTFSLDEATIRMLEVISKKHNTSLSNALQIIIKGFTKKNFEKDFNKIMNISYGNK